MNKPRNPRSRKFTPILHHKMTPLELLVDAFKEAIEKMEIHGSLSLQRMPYKGGSFIITNFSDSSVSKYEVTYQSSHMRPQHRVFNTNNKESVALNLMNKINSNI